MKKQKKIYKILLIVLVVGLMTGCETIENLDFNQECLRCGDDVFFPMYLVKLIANLVQFVQLMVPVIIIITGMIELLKAVIASDEKKMAESKGTLIKKFIVGIMIFLVIAVIRFIFSAIPDFTDGDVDVMECMSSFFNGPELITGCPTRIDGKQVSVDDDEEAANVNFDDDDDDPKKEDEEEEEEEKKPGTHATCDAIGSNRKECTDAGCDFDPHANECTAKGRKAPYKCYKCERGDEYRWSYGNPSPNYCTFLSDVKYKSECNSSEKKKEQRCWKCDKAGYTYYDWKAIKPNQDCVAISAASSAECQSGSAGKSACYKCGDKFEWHKESPGGKCKKTNLSKAKCSSMNKKK